MIAGSLDRRITLRRAVTRTDEFGAAIETWNDIGTVWASMVQVSNQEQFAAQQVGAETVLRFQIRFSTRVRELSPRDRLIFAGREYNITGVAMIGRDEGLEITADFREPA
jgi:SPP1 family predicted phage head-tail adaptor